MPTLNLMGRGPITLEEALNDEENVINWASWGPATEKLTSDLWDHREAVEALVRHHMALGRRAKCTVLPQKHWIVGGFNLCVLVELDSPSQRVVFRCPMPHKLAEARYPGSVDEKLSCEVGAHVWVEEKCPDIRSPHLFGFGFQHGRHFTHIKHASFFSRILRRFWRSVYRFFQWPLLSSYVPSLPRLHVPSAYLLLEYLGPEVGRTLTETFNIDQGNEDQRSRLFTGISRILLSLARVPQPRIGSFRFNQDGTVELANRPLSCSMMMLENDDASRTIQKDETFSCTDVYASEIISFHDNRFLSQPNAVYNEQDCHGQLAVKTLLRVYSHQFIKRDHRNGPFTLQLSDFHASNVMVDENWNVTALLDLE
jgi:hypothetical protein